MKKLIVTTTSILILISISLAIPKKTSGQQQFFYCDWDATLPTPACAINCSTYNCGGPCPPPGSPEQQYCAQFDIDDCVQGGLCQDCNTPFQCLPSPCPTGYIDYSNIYSCVSQSDICCLQDTITPPPNTVCYECILNPYGPMFCAKTLPNSQGSCTGFISATECNNNCPPNANTTWNCDPDLFQCMATTNGTYTDYVDCYSNCKYQASCIGPISGLPGDCQLAGRCPAGTFPDGVNPFYDICGRALHTCCVAINPLSILRRNPISPFNNCGSGEINTAIGCIPIKNLTLFSNFFLRFSLGIGGGFALLLIIFGGFQIITSSGNPERLQAGKELMISAASGLLLIIFSIFILELIGVRILGIPGF